MASTDREYDLFYTSRYESLIPTHSVGTSPIVKLYTKQNDKFDIVRTKYYNNLWSSYLMKRRIKSYLKNGV